MWWVTNRYDGSELVCVEANSERQAINKMASYTGAVEFDGDPMPINYFPMGIGSELALRGPYSTQFQAKWAAARMLGAPGLSLCSYALSQPLKRAVAVMDRLTVMYVQRRRADMPSSVWPW